MKRLVVCCDGTWNTLDQRQLGEPSPTNVVKLRNCVADRDPDGIEQRCYYHPGVGTEGGWLVRTAGGAWGKGLDRNIESAYRWLADEYDDGDELYLFGFSRGAYTVRSLGGMLGACGLLALCGLPDDVAWQRVHQAYERCYRRPPAERAGWAPADWAFHAGGGAVSIHFLGVWDTVGALGIPNDLGVLNLLDRPSRWRFHDTRLGKAVRRARHAIALDEKRASFTPTLWTAIEPPSDGGPAPDVEQRWFAGVHSDVGGGYSHSGLSDIALQWMIEEASATGADGAPGLAFRPDMVQQVRPDPLATLHDSWTGLFKRLRSRPRAIPAIDDGSSTLHASVLQRHARPPIAQAPYHPTRRLQPGESAAVAVFAHEPWNATGLYLEPGEYSFAATGEWMDARIRCGPGGARDGRFHPSKALYLVGSALGLLERAWQMVTRNRQAEVPGSRRAEDIPWFALVGVIANDGGRPNPDSDGSPYPHERFMIGRGAHRTIEDAGYLFAFANDAWWFYGNNRGSVTLTVRRVS